MTSSRLYSGVNGVSISPEEPLGRDNTTPTATPATGVTKAPHWSPDDRWTADPNAEGECRCPSGDPFCAEMIFDPRRALSKHRSAKGEYGHEWEERRRAEVRDANGRGVQRAVQGGVEEEGS